MQLSLRVITSMSVNYFDFKLFTRDVNQYYFQSEPLYHPFYKTPPPEENLSDEYILIITLPHQVHIESSTFCFDIYYPMFTKDWRVYCVPFERFQLL